MDKAKLDRMWEYHKEALSAVQDVLVRMKDDPEVDSDSFLTNVLVLIKVLVDVVESVGVPKYLIVDATGLSSNEEELHAESMEVPATN